MQVDAGDRRRAPGRDQAHVRCCPARLREPLGVPAQEPDEKRRRVRHPFVRCENGVEEAEDGLRGFNRRYAQVSLAPVRRTNTRARWLWRECELLQGPGPLWRALLFAAAASAPWPVPPASAWKNPAGDVRPRAAHNGSPAGRRVWRFRPEHCEGSDAVEKAVRASERTWPARGAVRARAPRRREAARLREERHIERLRKRGESVALRLGTCAIEAEARRTLSNTHPLF